MIVISTTAVPDHVRGALTRWLTEPAPGLYVGTVSARVREGLWSAVTVSVGDGSAVCIHPDDNEQRYLIRTAGKRRRNIFDADGLQLVRFTAQEPHASQ
ncbi:MAG: type I-E CRISPR-associated endoribonuclease Cas2e [Streptosporangiaceae bacterium]